MRVLYFVVSSLYHILETIGAGRLCSGNNDKRFLSLPNIRKGVWWTDQVSAKLLDSTLKHGGRYR